MRLRLSPRETSFYDMFSAAANNLVVTGELLAELVADGPDRVVLAGKIRDAEHVGDDITHRILRQLNSTFVTPFDRRTSTGWPAVSMTSWTSSRPRRT